MINYKQITELFGAPLNTVPKPQVPFQLKPWHVVGVTIVAVLVWKGIQTISDDLKYSTRLKMDKNRN